MNESATPHRSSLGLPPASPSSAALVGVRGWLLVLCLMFTVVGPAIAVWLMAHEYASAAPLGAKPVAVDLVTTTIEAATAQIPADRLLFHVEVSLVPSLVFFTLCFAYLDRSRRVHATYGPQPADA
jgi:hypothetical protein